MNICIDQGNSRTKVALFEADIPVQSFIYKYLDLTEISTICQHYPVEQGIYASVATIDQTVIKYLQNHLKKFIILDPTTPLPIQNDYATLQTLGYDRLAAAIGANYLQPNRNLLIIDAGSAITYDFVTDTNHYIGGNIAPGLKMRLRSLHDYTTGLPLVDVCESQQPIELFGNTTHSAIYNGVMNGICFEIDGYIHHCEKSYRELCVFLTGGNLSYFHNRLKNTIFAERNLVLIGLNRILEYNA